MYLSYFDESGDDGVPWSSDFFILSNLYMNEGDWKDNFEIIHQFRKQLSNQYGFPVKVELHTNDFIKGNGIFWEDFTWSAHERLEIVEKFISTMVSMEIDIINTVINKDNVIARSDITEEDYDVLDTSLSYNLSRTKTDLEEKESSERKQRLITVTDKGRTPIMRKVARKRQVYNPIRSHFGGTYQYRIKRLIEDPLPKDSEESFFIQLADLMATIVLLHVQHDTGKNWSVKLPSALDYSDVENWLDILKRGVLNTQASSDSEYGIVQYPEAP